MALGLQWSPHTHPAPCTGHTRGELCKATRSAHHGSVHFLDQAHALAHGTDLLHLANHRARVRLDRVEVPLESRSVHTEWRKRRGMNRTSVTQLGEPHRHN